MAVKPQDKMRPLNVVGWREELANFKKLMIREICSYNSDGTRLNSPRTQEPNISVSK